MCEWQSTLSVVQHRRVIHHSRPRPGSGKRGWPGMGKRHGNGRGSGASPGGCPVA
ncbi:hypothetical protein HMPREF0290_0032 [Corynebacterium efficiens YS-314]|nr:hypothetical protein HMPREF0290_0032 [Corynebacterium efficiens YS-314]